MGKRLLIAAGTAKYDHLAEDLQRDRLRQVVESIDMTFSGKLGYERVLADVSVDPTSSELEEALDDWFSSASRDPSDWIVVYYTGHGELADNHLHLLTRNYRIDRLPTTSVSTERLGDMLVAKGPEGKRRGIRHCLVILDTCYAGAGTFDLLTRVRTFFEQNGEGIFAVLAATLPQLPALAGALATALIEALQDESLGGAQQQWLTFPDVATAVARRLHPHLVLRSYSDSSCRPAEFFPNPRYAEGLPASATVQQVRQRAFAAHDLGSIWGPAARGIELELAEGWYFTGRERALNELAALLREDSDTRMRVVTGRPGSGKSALLATVVTHSDPVARNDMPAAFRRWHGVIPENSVNAAIHARGKTAAEVTDRIVAASGIKLDGRSLPDAVAASKQRFTFVLDALDEAREPARIAREVLRPLAPLGNVKLLVATRPEYVSSLGSNCVVIHVDDPGYLEQSDMADYVTARLLRSGGDAGVTPYAGQEALARRVGATVAEKAFPSFLIARMVADDLVSADAVVDEPTLRQAAFPESVADAFRRYLARFGEKERQVRDLLAPLAWAEGAGLPWSSIWPTVAARLAETPYDDDDIRWLLKNAASFVVETTEHGTTVYRLYHQALADYLRQGEDAAHVQSRVTDALIETVPELPTGAVRDWRLAPVYVRTHLAEHASACSRLAEMMRDPLFLLTADVGHLLPALGRQGHGVPDVVVRTYRSVIHQLRASSLVDGSSYLQMAARCYGAEDLAVRIPVLSLGQRWSVPWADWMPDLYSQTYAKSASDIFVLETAEWESGVPVVLVGREDGSVEVWDSGTNEAIVRWKPQGVQYTGNVLLARHDGDLVLLASWRTNHLGIRNLATDEEVIIALGEGDKNLVTALCVGRRGGRDVCVTAQRDHRLAIWSIPDLILLVERRQATPTVVYTMLSIVEPTTEMLLAGADTRVRVRDTDNPLVERSEPVQCGTLFLLSLRDLEIIWEGPPRQDGWVQHLESVTVHGQQLIVASPEFLGPLEIWDIARREVVLTVTGSRAQGWLRVRDGVPFLITVSYGRDALTIEELRPSPAGSGEWQISRIIQKAVPIGGSGFSRLTAVDSRLVFMAAINHQVLAFDLDELLAGAQVHTPEISSPVGARALQADAEALFVGTADGRILTLGTANRGAESGSPVERVNGVVAMGYLAHDSLLAVAAREGWVHLIETRSHRTVGSFRAGHEVASLAVTRWQGRPALLLGVRDREGWSAKLWDLESRSEIDSQRRYTLMHGEDDKRLQCVAAAEVGENLRFAFASSYSKVMVADFSAGLRPRLEPAFEEWHMGVGDWEYVTSLAIGHHEGGYWLAAGTAEGHLKVWDFLSGASLAVRKRAHQQHVIGAVRFNSPNGVPLLVSGGDDGMLRFWTPQLEERFSIDVGVRINDAIWTDANTLAVATDRGVLKVQVQERVVPGAAGANA